MFFFFFFPSSVNGKQTVRVRTANRKRREGEKERKKKRARERQRQRKRYIILDPVYMGGEGIRTNTNMLSYSNSKPQHRIPNFLAGVSRIWTGELICKPTGTIEKGGGGEDIRKNSRALVEAAGPRFFGGETRNLLINYRHRSKSPVFSFVNAAAAAAKKLPAGQTAWDATRGKTI